MASVRRSKRSKSVQKKYTIADPDDEQDQLEAILGSDSGSDFEQDIKKKKALAAKSSSESSEVDEHVSEEEEDEQPVKVKRKIEKKQPQQGLSKMNNIIKKREKMLEAKTTKMAAQKKSSIFFAAPSASCSKHVMNSLSLSESSSSDDEDQTAQQPTKIQSFHKKSPLKKPPMTVTKLKKESSDDEEEDLALASQLENLAQSYALKLDDPKKYEVSSIKTTEENSESINIANLLKQGEGVDFSMSDDEEEDDSENEIKPSTSKATDEPVVCDSISIELPHEDARRRRKKKGFDMEGFVRRELARAQRELQMLRHQGHVLCLIAHLKYLNSVTTAFDTIEGRYKSGDLCVAVAMSIIPPAHTCTAKELTLVKLTSFASWFKSAFQCLKETESTFPSPLSDWLIRAMENFICVSAVQRVLIFLCAVRSMGWPARLVLNIDATSMKPEKSLAGKLSEIIGTKSKSENNPKSPDQNVEPIKDSPKRVSKSKNTESPTKRPKEEEINVKKSPGKEKDSPKKASKSKKTEPSNKKPRDVEINDKKTRSSKSKSEKKLNSKDESSSPTKSKKADKEDSKKKSAKNHKSKKGDDEPMERKTRQSKKKSKSPEPKKIRLSDSALLEAEKRKKSKNQRATKSDYFTRRDSDSETDFVPEKRKRKTPTNSEEKLKAKPKSKSSGASKKGCPYWVEVFVTKSGWIAVDVDQGRVDCAKELEERSGVKPMLYVVAANADGTLKDVTKRYACERYDTVTRKARNPTESWFTDTIRFFERSPPNALDEEEDKQLEKISTSAPMPTSIGAFKNHPLYVLSRHLLKFEAIYPADAPPLGYIKSEPIYARECVHTLHCRVTWLKEGRVVRVGQEPYKIVKARPKWDRMTGNVIKDQPLEVFGRWQTEMYIPPPAADGKVPRNEYGNVELFKPWMLPKGTVHLPIAGLNRVAKKLGIDCASAMIGWEFSGGGCHPVFDGFVVCEEFQDTLMDAWNADVEEKEKKAAEKKTKKALDNWRKLIRGLLMHEKIRKKYSKKA